MFCVLSIISLFTARVQSQVESYQPYKVRIKSKVEQSMNGVVFFPTPWCSSYWKGSPRVTLNFGQLLNKKKKLNIL